MPAIAVNQADPVTFDVTVPASASETLHTEADAPYRAASESWPVDIPIEVAGYPVHFTEARMEERSGTIALTLTSAPLDHPRDDRWLAGLQFGAVTAPDGRTVNPDTTFASVGPERSPEGDVVGPHRAWLTFDVADPETHTMQPGRYRVELAGATVAVAGPWELMAGPPRAG